MSNDETPEHVDGLKQIAAALADVGAEYKTDGDGAWINIDTGHNAAIQVEVAEKPEWGRYPGPWFAVHARWWDDTHALAAETLLGMGTPEFIPGRVRAAVAEQGEAEQAIVDAMTPAAERQEEEQLALVKAWLFPPSGRHPREERVQRLRDMLQAARAGDDGLPSVDELFDAIFAVAALDEKTVAALRARLDAAAERGRKGGGS